MGKSQPCRAYKHITNDLVTLAGQIANNKDIFVEIDFTKTIKS
jgi:hypothetical protein